MRFELIHAILGIETAGIFPSDQVSATETIPISKAQSYCNCYASDPMSRDCLRKLNQTTLSRQRVFSVCTLHPRRHPASPNCFGDYTDLFLMSFPILHQSTYIVAIRRWSLCSRMIGVQILHVDVCLFADRIQSRCAHPDLCRDTVFKAWMSSPHHATGNLAVGWFLRDLVDVVYSLAILLVPCLDLGTSTTANSPNPMA